MELRCPNCGSSELRKAFLVYEEGRYHARSRTRLRGLVLGGDGLDFIIANAHTGGMFQTELSKRLQPPRKWSYLKLAGWFAVSSVVALVAYVQSFMAGSGASSSPPVAIFVTVGTGIFLLLGLIVWRHNHAVYPQQLNQWNRTYFCDRCGSSSIGPE